MYGFILYQYKEYRIHYLTNFKNFSNETLQQKFNIIGNFFLLTNLVIVFNPVCLKKMKIGNENKNESI